MLILFSDDVRSVGKQLNVRTVLLGSVRRSGNELRITAQLVNVEDGYHLWSDRFDREVKDIFEIQDEIAPVDCGAVESHLEKWGAGTPGDYGHQNFRVLSTLR